ncbi:ScbA/BarX family gamma-butyrolactone biosynthesis protein [Streptomyces sp. NPDC044780]|uniref:ScbA/BarX family gamma-butyrolactone biosynthesis protein n=1 Tax=unclassified Streptomyces TaxID=2593676 RepID=UPI00341041A8
MTAPAASGAAPALPGTRPTPPGDRPTPSGDRATPPEGRSVLPGDRTVPRRLVHKRAVEQVLTTGVAECGGRLLGSAQLPRLHRYFNDTRAPYYDLLLVGEAARQTVEAMAHELLGVPLDSPFVLSDLAIELTGPEALRVGPAPVDLGVELHIDSARRRRDGSVRALRGTAVCRVAEREAARFSGTLRFLEAGAYAELRAGPAAPAPPATGAPPRSAPAAVGRTDPRNVVLGRIRHKGEETVARLVCDPGDPVFFDHPLDHLPGMLLMEAGRQIALAARAQTAAVPATELVATSCRAGFREFAEHTDPVWCRARPTAAGTIEAVVEQRGRPAALLEVAVARVTDRGIVP